MDDVRIRWIGHNLRVEAKITVDCESSLVEAHTIAENAHHDLLHRLPRLREALIHTNPCNHDGADHHAPVAHHFANS